MAVLPIGSPRDADLRFRGGDAVEPLAGVVVFCEIGDAGRGVGGGEDGAVEGAGEVLGYGAAEGGAGVDADGEKVHVQVGGEVGGCEGRGEGGVGEHGDGDEVGAFVLQAEQTVVAEVGGVRPGFEVRGGVDSDDEVLGVGDDHYPGGGLAVPDDFGVTELGAVDGEDGVVGVFGECVAVVEGVGDFLGFFLGGVEGVNGDDAVGLVGEESAGVVYVDDCRSRKDAFTFGSGVNGDGLVCPVV